MNEKNTFCLHACTFCSPVYPCNLIYPYLSTYLIPTCSSSFYLHFSGLFNRCCHVRSCILVLFLCSTVVLEECCFITCCIWLKLQKQIYCDSDSRLLKTLLHSIEAQDSHWTILKLCWRT